MYKINEDLYADFSNMEEVTGNSKSLINEYAPNPKDLRIDTTEQIVRSVKSWLMFESGKTEIEDAELVREIEDRIFKESSGITVDEMKRIKDRVLLRLRSPLGILQPLVSDPGVNEVMVNGVDNIFVERNGKVMRIDDSFSCEEELKDIIRYIAGGVHREFNELNPIVDARLPDGSRVCGIYNNVAIGGPALSIRKFRKEKINMDSMLSYGSITSECAEELKKWVKAGYNIFVSGGTSSGKTTFLNALSDYIPSEERIVVIEDSSELNMNQVDNIVYMECRNANSIGRGGVDMSSLIKTSLRLRPDRIIVGEVRGGEVFQMVQAMNSGHSGSMSTGHGNSVQGMLRRLESMYLMAIDIPVDAIRMQIAEAIDIMVHLNRRRDGTRAVESVAELVGYEKGEYVLNYLYEMDDNLNLTRTENKMIRTIKMRKLEKE
ncbi:MAG: ATPase, T2SS/T4P/T4SS family [Clostridiales bacterium]|nr:ATPase, T2SS/T4P/T4SS family [Clostridiales bacterium]MDY4060023.1 ATPase, T2SS/T4P/T4SS family [Anaerovoracaceae bacterium]